MFYIGYFSYESAPFKPLMYKCYVDDTLLVWSHRWEQLDNFVSHMNSFLNSIQFTTEWGTQGRMSAFSGHKNHKTGRWVSRASGIQEEHTYRFVSEKPELPLPITLGTFCAWQSKKNSRNRTYLGPEQFLGGCASQANFSLRGFYILPTTWINQHCMSMSFLTGCL